MKEIGFSLFSASLSPSFQFVTEKCSLSYIKNQKEGREKCRGELERAARRDTSFFISKNRKIEKKKKWRQKERKSSVYTSFRKIKVLCCVFSSSLSLCSEVVENVEPRRQRLPQLARLLGVGDDQSVEVARAADLELGDAAGGFLHADGAGVLAAGREEEVLDLVDLLGLLVWVGLGLRGGEEREREREEVEESEPSSIARFSIKEGRRSKGKARRRRVQELFSVNCVRPCRQCDVFFALRGEKKRAQARARSQPGGSRGKAAAALLLPRPFIDRPRIGHLQARARSDATTSVSGRRRYVVWRCEERSRKGWSPLCSP